MSRDTDKLLAEALKLSLEARAELATQLLRSLDEDELDEDEYQALWGAEIKRRLEEIDAGKVDLLSREDAMRLIDSDDPDTSR